MCSRPLRAPHTVNRRRGDRAERVAARYLQRRGWRILARNWRGGGGELDLVAARRRTLVIVEVKTRSEAGWLEDPVGWRQTLRIHRAAAAYLRHSAREDWEVVRIDVIAVHRRGWRTVVTHHHDALVSP